jgi:hypothetical protein
MKLIFVNFVHQISGEKLLVHKFLEKIILVKPELLDIVEVIDNQITMVAVEVVDVVDVVQVLVAHLDLQVQMVCPGKMVPQDNLEMLAEMVLLHLHNNIMTSALIAPLDPQENLEMLEERVLLVELDNLAGHLMVEDVDPLALLVDLAHKVELVALDKLEDPDLLDKFELFLAQWDHLDPLVDLDNLEDLAPVETLDKQDVPDKWDNLEMLDKLVLPVNLVPMVIMVQMVIAELVVNVHIVLHHVLLQVIKLDEAAANQTLLESYLPPHSIFSLIPLFFRCS